MADLEGQWVPRTEEEFEYLQGLFSLTGQAYQSGVPKEDVLTGLMFVAASIAAQDPGEIEEPDGVPADSKREDCPECGEEIDDVRAAMGGDVEVQPCGCETTVEDLPGWFDV